MVNVIQAALAVVERPSDHPAPTGDAKAFVETIRLLLPPLLANAEDYLREGDHSAVAYTLRAGITGAPEIAFDGSCPSPAKTRHRQLAHEAAYSWLLATIFRISIAQGLGLELSTSDLYPCIPELSAYDWFPPSPESSHSIEDRLADYPLWPMPMDLASDMYQKSLTREEKKALGQYYTPSALASHLLDQAGYVSGQGLMTQTILDVATGFGVFLAEAAHRLIDEMRTQRRPLVEIVEALGANLGGYDLQPFAVIATKLHILAVLINDLQLDGNEVARVCSMLQLPGIRVVDTLTESLEVPIEAAPHFVVGNPPYGSCRHGDHIDPYRAILASRANYYQLFFYFALRRCRPGGCVALLVPESMRAGRFFRLLRQYVAQETCLRAMTDFHARTAIFGGVEQGVLILATRKGPCTRSDKQRPVAVVQTATVETLPTSRPLAVPRHHVQAGPEAAHLLLKASSTDAYALLHKLSATSSRGPNIDLSVHTGPFVWNRHKNGFAPTHVPNSYAVIYAPSVRRYGFSFPPDSQRTSCHGRLYAMPSPDRPLPTIAGRVLLLQRTTAREQLRRLVATAVPSWFVEGHASYLVENHVNYIPGATSGRVEIPLLYVLALLNSRLLNFLFAAINGSTQVSAYELGLLPLLYDRSSDLEVLADLRLCHSDAKAGTQAGDRDRTIDACVYDIYGLTATERSLVDTYHMASHSGAGQLLVRES